MFKKKHHILTGGSTGENKNKSYYISENIYLLRYVPACTRMLTLNIKPKLYSGLNVRFIEPCPSLARFLVFYITGICTWRELGLRCFGNVNLINYIVKKCKQWLNF